MDLNAKQTEFLEKLKVHLIMAGVVDIRDNFNTVLEKGFAPQNLSLLGVEFSLDQMNDCYKAINGVNNSEYERISKISLFGGSSMMPQEQSSSI
ncbi:MAG TPA: hypothetical protein PKI61_01680 [bacterium]|nr:hypothetical protein [bacterium]HPT30161.1 hypothetical protein [bacterium]